MREGRRERRKLGGMEIKAEGRREEEGVNIMITDIQHKNHPSYHSMDLNII